MIFSRFDEHFKSYLKIDFSFPKLKIRLLSTSKGCWLSKLIDISFEWEEIQAEPVLQFDLAQSGELIFLFFSSFSDAANAAQQNALLCSTGPADCAKFS